jgi:leucyl-tRNA synthetase
MHKKFDSNEIEVKWQAEWSNTGLYKNKDSDKPKVFILDMFPYPSGEGLHVGHPKGYIATDIYSRFKRMTGHEVLHPMGWDAFGLPAENYAIKNKVHPRVAVEKNIANFKSQLAKLGFDYDWGREINTTDPHYYKWTQWIFIQLLKKGLAYQSYEPINWCPGCQTGLANEDLESDGTCERCGSVVEKKPMRQWVLKIREYADRMLEDLGTLAWPEHIKEAQRNWIGRSQGAEIDFNLSVNRKVTVFTTRPDTLYGATYLVLAPEHPLLQDSEVRGMISNLHEVEVYIAAARQKSEQTRLDATKEKTGVLLEGITATNPASGETIPVYIADYVLGGYGTGAIMAVPAHDERDGEFARKFGLPVKQVIAPHYDLGPKAGVETLERGDVVDLIIEHPTDGTFLLQKEITSSGAAVHFVGGGTEGESHHVAIKRELEEETGFTEFEIVSGPYGIHTALAYRETKNKNQRTKSHFYHVRLKSLTQKTSEIEEGKHTIEWMKPEEIHKQITWIGHQFGWRAFYNHEVYVNSGRLINSEEFDGIESEEAKVKIVEKVGGRMVNTYKIRDWVFSRQRYWGEPIPVVHTEDGRVYPVAMSDLPVLLPEVESYAPTGNGESPLAVITDWVNVTGYINTEGEFVAGATAPAGSTLITAKRETNTMPQWAGSSWYYLRYIDPTNDQALIDPAKEKTWQPVDVYVGGDHAVRHLIYARFWHKFLYDIGVVSTIEPFQRLEFLGFILAEDGRKMSKRWGNVINPDDIVAQVGADTLRVYEMFMGPFENTIAWSKDGVVGARRFLERVNGLVDHLVENESNEVTRQLHKTIKKVTEDIEQFKFNTAVSAMMIFVNVAEKHGLTKVTYEIFIKLLAPFAPHLTEEIWHALGHQTSIHVADFPVADETLARDTTITLGVQINGKMRGTIEITPDATEVDALKAVEASTTIAEKLSGNAIDKVIYVPGRILNLLVSEK